MRALTQRNSFTGQIEWVKPEDGELVAGWISGDDDHRGKMDASFYLQELTESLMFGDAEGDLFAVRLCRVLRTDIQFNPDPAARERIRAELLRYFPWLREEAKKNGFKQMIFDSIARPLIAFCVRRFGFKGSPTEYIAGTEVSHVRSNIGTEATRTAAS